MFEFAHLHVHSEYDRGMMRIPELAKRARELGMHSLALTDRWSLSGAVELIHCCQHEGLAPIFGCEIVARMPAVEGTIDLPLVLLIENEDGRRNLCRLLYECSVADSPDHTPADILTLRKHSAGLVAFSQCLPEESPAPPAKIFDLARAAMWAFKNIYPDFFLELCNHGEPGSAERNGRLANLADELDIPVIVTNNCLYLDEADLPALEVLYKLKGIPLPAGGVGSLAGRGFCSAEEMAAKFDWLPPGVGVRSAERREQIAFNAMVEIGSFDNLDYLEWRLHYRPEPVKLLIPRLRPSTGLSPAEELAELARAGLASRRPLLEITDPRLAEREQEYQERLDRELHEIGELGWTDYLLLIADLRQLAKDRGIGLGPSGGAINGSLVSFCLGLTDINPLAFGLLLVRLFREVKYPWINIYVDDERQEEFFGCICERLGGPDRAARPLDFHGMNNRPLLERVADILGLPEATLDELRAKIPPDRQLREMREESFWFSRRLDSDPLVRTAWELALRLDGVIGGENTCQTLLVSDRPLTELAPARRTSAGPAVVELSQHLAESAGLIPTPIQSLKEAGRMQRCLERIRQRRGVEIDLDRIPLDDPAAFDSICLGESDLTDVMGDSMTREMREYSDRGQPRSLTDLSALFALYRPGPINAGIVEQFFWRKRHPLLYPAPSFPVLTEILEETRGLWVYQEQFMAAAAAVAGFSPSDAEKMWREIVRRRSREIELWRARFIEGAAARGADPKDAERLFEDFEKDAPSSFMKAHAIHLALMIYRGAWLKAHYPEEFDASEGENS